jgi:hypothetical protein
LASITRSEGSLQKGQDCCAFIAIAVQIGANVTPTRPIQAFGRGTNLHSLWDSGMIRNWPDGLDELRAAIKAAPVVAADSIATQVWGEERCRVVSTTGFYPEGHTLPTSYQTQWSATVPAQLAAAGRRITALLESALTNKGAAR